jgi:phage-related protein
VSTWHGLETAWNAVAGAALSLWNSVVGVWNAIVNTTVSVWNTIKAFFEKWWPLLLVIFAFPIGVLVAIWNHFHKQIIDTARTVWNAVSGFFVGQWHMIVGLAKGAWAIFQAVVITPIREIWTLLQPVIHMISGFLNGQWNGIVSQAKGAWTLVKQVVIQPIIDAWNWLTGFLYNFFNFGIDLVNGMIKGVEGAASYLINAMTNLASNALKAAKSFLGIGSPSKVFADEVGKWIPHGIAAGIDKHAEVAHAAVRRLGAGLTASAKNAVSGQLTVAGGLTTGGIGAGSSSASELHIHVDLRGAQIMSDRDTDQLLQKMEKRLATLVLPSGGYRSRF